MSEAERLRLERSLTPRLTSYTRLQLGNHRQVAFLLLADVKEILFGGAAGGGKSWGMLAAASQFFDVPGYSALILRRRFRDLALPGALMPISHSWWDSTDARYDKQNYKWIFPSGAVLQFGYLEHEGDELQYQSAAFQFVGFDELSQFSEYQYLYMFSRLRRPMNIDGTDPLSQVPLRMRAATNPGGPGHEWVKKRWGIHMVPAKGGLQQALGVNTPSRRFIPSRLDDNIYLDQDSYRDSLSELSDVTRAQLEHGDWGAQATGGVFNPFAIGLITPDDLPDRRFWISIVRHWDLASTEPTEVNPNPDWTAGVKMLKTSMPPPSAVEYHRQHLLPLPPPPYWIVLHVVRDRREPSGVERLVADTANRDGLHVPISIEQERGATGKSTISAYRNHVVPGFEVFRLWLAGDKVKRARNVAAMVNKGRVWLVDGPWREPFLDELGIFDGGRENKDDQVDGLSGAFEQLDKLEAIREEQRAGQY